MSTNLTAQTVAVLTIPGTSISEQAIISDSSIQQAAANSLGQDVLVSWQPYYNFTGGVEAANAAFTLTFFVTPTVAGQIVSGIPAFQSRLQAQVPGVQRVVTWATQIAFG